MKSDMDGMEQQQPYQEAFSPSNTNFSAGSPPGGGESSVTKKAHTRTYQACAPCRSRKVKCDMGSVDNPHPPPCARCKREQKACTFDTTRRKTNGKKRENSETDDLDNVYGQDNKRRYVASRTFEHPFNGQNAPTPPQAFTPGGQHPMYYSQSPVAPHTPHSPIHIDAETAHRAGDIMKGETFNATNTLSVLVDAAEAVAVGEANAQQDGRRPRTSFGAKPGFAADLRERYPMEELQEAAKAWNRFLLVRAGHFKPADGIAYVDYFYSKCAPFTPIAVPDYARPLSHKTLLEKEPFLVMTILTIASRFVGPASGGEKARSQNIHDICWKRLHDMFNRLMWAQEQFGGGFSGGGKSQAALANQALPLFGLRSISTVESLLLLTEWHPRSMHFPPGYDDGQLMVPENPDDEFDIPTIIPGQMFLNGTGTDRRDSWLEPSWRSNCMIWFLLNNALGLSLQIGILDDKSEEQLVQENLGIPEEEVRMYHKRKRRAREMLWTFFVQASGRLEIIGQLPPTFLNSIFESAEDRRIAEIVQSQRVIMNQGSPPTFSPSFERPNYWQDPKDAVCYFFQKIAAIMKSANETMFGQASRTRNIINSGEYHTLIAIYASLLQEWQGDFAKCRQIEEPMRSILLIEYEYVRIYLHSLSLQAFVNRVIASTPSKQHFDVAATRNDSVINNGNGSHVPLEDVRKWMQGDQKYVSELVDACSNVLRVISDFAVPAEGIKHFTVRTYFRILTAAVFLMKTLFVAHKVKALLADDPSQSFLVGAFVNEVAQALMLLKKASYVLKTKVVDDVHISNTFADMIFDVSNTIIPSLKRFQRNPNTGAATSRAQSRSPPMSSTPAPAYPSHTSNPQNFGWPTNSFRSPGMNGPFSGLSETRSLLNNVELWDSNNGSAATVMPPPNYYADFDSTNDAMGNFQSVDGMGGGADGDFLANSGGSDWVAFDLTPLVGLAGQANEVSNTHVGAAVNNVDVLDMVRGIPGAGPTFDTGYPMMQGGIQQLTGQSSGQHHVNGHMHGLPQQWNQHSG